MFRQFDQEIQRLNLDWVPDYGGNFGVRTGDRKSRLPDLVVMTAEQEAELLYVSAVLQIPPLLAVEVVSEDEPARDYRYKRSEYAAREIPEYWIVDPQKRQIVILTLVEGLYEEQTFIDSQRLSSPTFPELQLTAAQVFST